MMCGDERLLLIVDDDGSLRQMLGWEFADLGYQVTLAANLHEGLQIARQQKFHCALLDYYLPDGTGRDLLQQLLVFYPELAAVIMSASCSPQAIQEVRRLGALEFVEKPVPIDKLNQLFSA